jgi:hypothetical protein
MRIVLDPDALAALLMGNQLHIPESALKGFLEDTSVKRDIIIHLSEDALSMGDASMVAPESDEVH